MLAFAGGQPRLEGNLVFTITLVDVLTISLILSSLHSAMNCAGIEAVITHIISSLLSRYLAKIKPLKHCNCSTNS